MSSQNQSICTPLSGDRESVFCKKDDDGATDGVSDITLSEVDEGELSDTARVLTPPVPKTEQRPGMHVRGASCPSTGTTQKSHGVGVSSPSHKRPVGHTEPVDTTPHETASNTSSGTSNGSLLQQETGSDSTSDDDIPQWLQATGGQGSDTPRTAGSKTSDEGGRDPDPGRRSMSNDAIIYAAELERVKQDRDRWMLEAGKAEEVSRALQEDIIHLRGQIDAMEGSLFDIASEKAKWSAEKEKLTQRALGLEASHAAVTEQCAEKSAVLVQVLSEQYAVIAERDQTTRRCASLTQRIEHLEAEATELRAAMEEGYAIAESWKRKYNRRERKEARDTRE